PPPLSPRFPYTTLFRSPERERRPERGDQRNHVPSPPPRPTGPPRFDEHGSQLSPAPVQCPRRHRSRADAGSRRSDNGSDRPEGRSEEHTSELQSRENLV